MLESDEKFFDVITNVCLFLLLLLLVFCLHNVLDTKWVCIHLLLLKSPFLNSEWFSPYILSSGSNSWFPRWQWSLISMAFSGLSFMAFYHYTLFKSHLWRFIFLPFGLGSSREVGRDHIVWTLCPIVNIPCTQEASMNTRGIKNHLSLENVHKTQCWAGCWGLSSRSSFYKAAPHLLNSAKYVFCWVQGQRTGKSRSSLSAIPVLLTWAMGWIWVPLCRPILLPCKTRNEACMGTQGQGREREQERRAGRRGGKEAKGLPSSEESLNPTSPETRRSNSSSTFFLALVTSWAPSLSWWNNGLSERHNYY